MSLPKITDDGIPVLWRDHPFHGEVKHILVQPTERMPSIAEIVHSIPDLPEDIRSDGAARLNGIIVPREMWATVRPKYLPGSIGITFHHSVAKGGARSSIVSIAALLAAAAISGGLAAPVLGALFTAGTIGSTVLAVGVGVLGSLAASALAPPPIEAAEPGKLAAGPELHDASLGGNGVARGQPIQRVIGTYKVAPQRLTDPLVEQIGWDRWVECIYGLAGPHDISEIYFDGQLVDTSTNTNVLIEAREGWVSDSPLTLITRQSKTDPAPIELSQHKVNRTLPLGTTVAGSRLSDSAEAFHEESIIGGHSGGPSDTTYTIDVTKIVPEWHRITTKANPDEFWLALNFAEGLVDLENNPTQINPIEGTYFYGATAFRLRMRRKGDSTWINLPELHVANSRAENFRCVIKFMWQDIPGIMPKPPDFRGPGFYLAYKSVPGQTLVTPVTSGWTADAWFSGGSVVNATRDQVYSFWTTSTTNVRNVRLFEDRAELFLTGSGTPFSHTGTGIWEIEIRQSSFYSPVEFANTQSLDANSPGSYTYWSSLTNLQDGWVYDFFEYRVGGTNDYRTPYFMNNVRYQVTIDQRSNVWHEYPIVESGSTEDRLAKLAIKVRNQQVNQITVVANGYIHVWNGSDWNNYGTSSNPAENFREVLNGVLGKQPQDASAINDSNVLAWRQHCIDNDYTIDTPVLGKSYRDVIKLIAAAGWARERDAEQWSVLWDHDRSSETPGQIFTAREVNEVSISKPFNKIPDGFRATFLNEDDNYNSDEVVVLDPYNPGATEYGVEEVSYSAFSDPAKVAARALFDIKQAHKRQQTFQFKTDTLSIMCERGDLIGVNYDTLSKRYGSARIQRIVTSGGSVTGLVLDGTVNELPTTAYARIRKKGGAGYIDAQIVPFAAATDTISFVSPFGNPGTSVLDVGAVVWVGNLTATERRLIVTGIAPGPDFTATITAVDESPEIFS